MTNGPESMTTAPQPDGQREPDFFGSNLPQPQGSNLPDYQYVDQLADPPTEPTPRTVPHLGHTAIFMGLVVGTMLVVMFAVGIAIGLHLLGIGSFEKLQKDPLLVVPTMAAWYLLAWGASFFIFPLMWQRSFLDGVSWNRGVVSRRWKLLLITGFAIGLGVQFLSNFLPIPKTLPIDDFFRTRTSIWIVSIFGVFIAPASEELAFRGFLLPSLATAWDWLGNRTRNQPPRPIDPISGQPSWSLPARIFAAIATSIPFAMLHADQLAHAWAPLAVLFGVSILLCVVRFRTSSLAASVVVHATYNFSIFLTLYIVTGGFRHLEKMRG
jgi:membrane protease YdiL (CAAX protease family)